MTKLAGKLGFVSYSSGTEILGIKSWTLDYVVDALETTDFADEGTRTYKSGCSSWSGSFEGFKDAAPPDILGTVYSCTFAEDSSAGNCWTGSAFITGMHPSVSFDGVVAYAWDFQGTGTLTIAST